uniref:FXYD domain containing ion transport regulator 3 n=2 Tax=Canis lupus familiaris TaxID=9615 RepID=A0A8C0PUK8_CANLF
MQEVALSLLIFLAGLPALEANDPEDKDSPFYYGENCRCLPATTPLPAPHFVPRGPHRSGRGLMC